MVFIQNISRFHLCSFMIMKNYYFFVDDDRWKFEGVIKWTNIFVQEFPNIKFCILPLSMFKSAPKITGKEYSMLNNILKRCVE